MTIVLVTGPARSGKSEWAERLAQQNATAKNQQVIYIATAKSSPDDAEWQARIEQHKQRRPAQWRAYEVPVDLAQFICQHGEAHCLLIDSLGTWLANLIEQDASTWNESQEQLMAALKQTSANVILVAEETGWGVVPAYELGRTFRDRLGTLSRSVGEFATDVYLVTSGYAINVAAIGSAVGQRVNSDH